MGVEVGVGVGAEDFSFLARDLRPEINKMPSYGLY